MADLVKYRHRFLVQAAGSVEIRVTFAQEKTDGKVESDAWYECTSCGDQLRWDPVVRHWECTECGYSLTGAEATQLCEQHIGVVRHLSALTDERKGLLCRLLRFFRAERSKTQK